MTDAPTLSALQSPTSNGSAQGLAFLYPYDQTVFPRGLLAPLIQWTWSTGNADAIQISLKTTSGSFSYTGTFSAPPILKHDGRQLHSHAHPAGRLDDGDQHGGRSRRRAARRTSSR